MKARGGDTVGVEVRRDGGCRSRDGGRSTCVLSGGQEANYNVVSSPVSSPPVNITAERGLEIESCAVPFHKINSTLSVRTF